MRRVAITGVGVVCPLGPDLTALYDGLLAGRSAVGPISRFDADTFDVRLAAEAPEAPTLPSAVAAVAARDRKVGFAWTACEQALSTADVDRLDADTLLHLGTSLESFDLEQVVVDGRVDLAEATRRCLATPGATWQVPLDTAARLIDQACGPAGRVCVNCSACAAGAQAIGHAFHGVRAGRWQRAVCGGFDSMLNPLGIGGFQLLGALTTSNERGAGACRPFDAARDGTVLGEGAAVVVLEPLAAARAAGRPVLAEVLGYASTLDATGLSAPAPDGSGAVRAMRGALADAGLAPTAIGYINAHGTGTFLNDRIEAAAIRTVFAERWPELPVSSTKSMTGHLIAAAGAVELAACLLPLQRGVLPPVINLESVGEGCQLCHPTGRPRPFPGGAILSNSFGFGGQNASLVLGDGDD